MDFRKISVDDAPDGLAPVRVKKELDEAVGATEFGCNYYEAETGELVPWGYHRHPDHEELFFVIEGDLSVETPDGDYHVGPNEAFFVPKNGRNRARVVGDSTCRFLAMGAPKETDAAIIEEECPDCGETTELDVERTDGEYVLSCGACGGEIRRFEA